MRSLLIPLVFLLTSFSCAQPLYRGEVEFALDSSLSAAPAQPGWTLASHLEAGYDLEPGGSPPVAFSLVLDPSVRFSRDVSHEPGLTELYAATTYENVDLSAGVERLPLETARLSVPYSVETMGVRGVRRGVPGARGVLYSGDWRLRGAVFYGGAGQVFVENVTPLVSVRRTFDSFDLEAHALYQNGLVAGLGGSGLVGDLVLYGEAWLLSSSFAEVSGRGAFGLNGNLKLGTWTLEAAYLTPGNASVKDAAEVSPAQAAPTAEPRPAVFAQVALPLGDEGDQNLSLTGNTFFGPDAVRSAVGASYTLLSDAELTLGAGAGFGPEPTVVTLRVSVKEFF